jgi:hypothetical protein
MDLHDGVVEVDEREAVDPGEQRRLLRDLGEKP